MGGRSSSSSTIETTTSVADHRIGAADQARVVTGDGQIVEDNRQNITIRSADAAVIEAALAGSRGTVSEALEFSTRHSEQGARLVETALAGTQQDLAGFTQLNRTMMVALLGGVALVALVALRGR